MQTNLSYLNQRQDVLSQNIANANVPGYMAKDLKAPNFEDMLSASNSSTSSVNLALTEPGHMALNSAGGFSVMTKSKKDGEITPTGNSVVIEDEILKMSKNGMEYEQTADTYKKMLSLLQTAIGSA